MASRIGENLIVYFSLNDSGMALCQIIIRRRIKVFQKLKTADFSFLLGLENQYSVNLIYPWRLMETDCRTYGLQIEKLQGQNINEKRTYEGGDDFKYRYKKEDCLEPILNLTIYWGKKR